MPALHNYTSQQLAVPVCSPSPNIPAGSTAVLKCPLVSSNVPTRNCAWPAVCSDVICSVRRCGTGSKDVLLLRLTGASEGSNRSEVVVCSRRQAQTEQKRNEGNCTLIENEIFVRTIVFLGAFAKLRKATISIVMRARPSVPREQYVSFWTYFHEIWLSAFLYFSKIYRENYISLLSDKCH